MSRYAAIDCGTNSIRLLIAEVNHDGTVTELDRDNIIVRLGQGVDETGNFHPDALARVEAALRTYVARMQEYGVVDVMMGATSATRDAGNREAFFAMTDALLSEIRPGAHAQVITGEEEARLSFAGAVMDFHAADATNSAADSTAEGILVIDLGGGSTEFVIDGNTNQAQAYSANMGCVRLTERFLNHQPPTEAEVAEAQAMVETLMDEVEARVDFQRVRSVIGVAGTMTTLCALAQGLEEYDRDRIHMRQMTLEELRSTALDLLWKTPEERLAFGPMHPGRADVIGGGAIVVEAFTKRLERHGLQTISISEKDILDGILAEVIARNA